MTRAERRDRVALDEAYSYYRNAVVREENVELYQLVNALKTVSNALHSASESNFKLTTRLWLRIEQSLFDKLITSFSSHMVVLGPDGTALARGSQLPEGAMIELHPEGLRRTCDVFRMPVRDLPPLTQKQLERVWLERGPSLRREDFTLMSCVDGVCAVKPFAIGHEQLESEAHSGKQLAYQQYWELYWQAYCTDDAAERQLLSKQMSSLESVWGNLYY